MVRCDELSEWNAGYEKYQAFFFHGGEAWGLMDNVLAYIGWVPHPPSESLEDDQKNINKAKIEYRNLFTEKGIPCFEVKEKPYISGERLCLTQ